MSSSLALRAESGKRGLALKIQQQLGRDSQLPRARQRMVREVLGSLLAAHQKHAPQTP